MSTLLWALGSPERLSSRIRKLVDSGGHIVSVASYWEVVVKTQKRLLRIADLATCPLKTQGLEDAGQPRGEPLANDRLVV
jgi:PIN domain nuclease of toxin-antitoxin system